MRSAVAFGLSVLLACAHQPPAPAEGPLDRLRRACEAGDAQRCADLGAELEHERRWRADAGRDSFAAYERACELAHAQSCYLIAFAIEGGDNGAPAADPARAVATLERSCDLGEARACWELSFRYAAAHDGIKSPEKKLHADVRACRLGAWNSCSAALTTYLDAPTFDWAAIDEVLAHLECGGRTTGCDRLRGLYLLRVVAVAPRGVAPEVWAERQEARRAHARALIARGCESDEPRACLDLAHLLASGVGGAADVQGALALADRECERGDAQGCWSAARLRVSERAHRDLSAARAGFDRACAAQEDAVRRACTLAAAEVFATAGAHREAAALFAPPCEGGDHEACVRWGRTLAETPRTYRQAVGLFRDACDAGEPTGCARLARMMALGRGIKRDRAGAEALAARACSAGAIEACPQDGRSLIEQLAGPARTLARLTAAVGLFPVWQIIIGGWW